MELWIPASFTREAKFNCRFCGERFHTGTEQARHVVKCYRRNEGEIRMQSLREQAPALFGDVNVDTEFEQWHKKHDFRKAT